jgi:uncharacterized RDD family membrane protein YckC
MRFDEIELETVTLDSVSPQDASAVHDHAPRLRRLFALLTDLSLFVALAVGLSPLLPQTRNWTAIASLAGFVLVISFYYFVSMWSFWGKTIGGAIFDVRVISSGHASGHSTVLPSMALRTAALRLAGLYLSLLTGGIGFLLALLPSRRSLADRMSSTRCVTAT